MVRPAAGKLRACGGVYRAGMQVRAGRAPLSTEEPDSELAIGPNFRWKLRHTIPGAAERGIKLMPWTLSKTKP